MSGFSGGGGGGGTITSGTYASKPASPGANDQYIVTDMPGMLLMCSVAGTWRRFFNGIECFAPPAAASWTAIGGGTITIEDDAGCILVDKGTSASGDAWIITNVPTAPYVVTMLVQEQITKTNVQAQQFGFNQSGANTMGLFHYFLTNTFDERIQRNTTIVPDAGPSVLVSATTPPIKSDLYWCQLEDDNTSIYIRVSPDGVNWFTLHSELRGANFSTAPGKIAFCPCASGGNSGKIFRLLSWLET